LGDVTYYERFASTSLNAEEHQWRYFFYGQDTWRITPKLTLNYGLRWEIYAPESINEKDLGGLGVLDGGVIRVAGEGPYGLSFNVKNKLDAFAPRIGIAYSYDEKTVIRMGYGRSYDIGVFGSNFGHAVSQNLPVLVHQSINAGSLGLGANDYVTAFSLTTGAPAVQYPAVAANGTIALRGWDNSTDPRIRPTTQTLPTVDTWNVTLQRQLTPTTSLEIAYVGNKGTHVFAGLSPTFNVNQPTIVGYGTLSQAERRPFWGPLATPTSPAGVNAWSYTIPTNDTTTNNPGGTIYCCNTDLNNYFGNAATSNYNALQVKAEKRMSNGLQFIAHYTWARALAYDNNYFVDDPHVAYGPDPVNRNHVFVLNTVYELPFGRGHMFAGGVGKATDLLIGGWQISTTSNWSSGLPFSASDSFCGTEEDVGVCRPSKGHGFTTGAGSFDPVGHTVTYYTPVNVTNSSAWVAPGPGNLGNAGVYSLVGPRQFTTDATLMKNFALTERVKAQFRMDVFNLFNHPVYGFSSFQGDTCVAYTTGNPCSNVNAGKITDIQNDITMRGLEFAVRLTF
jgi:hypothetical protein